mmetsp:Transcript_92130/g.264041  ORF Transcript_92130/g.264041 Transcript_92130/m.264041 type:complete len:206 (+) Transcript_92130:1564-2181(+)
MEQRDIELLALLTESLSMELASAVVGPAILVHPFFSKYENSSRRAMQQVCSKAASQLRVSSGDVVFSSGEASRRALFVLDGKLVYCKETSLTVVSRANSRRSAVGHASAQFPNAAVAEAALWVSWQHFGELRAVTHSCLVAIDVVKFGEFTKQDQVALRGSRQCAAMYLQAMHDQEPSALSDMMFSCEQIQEMASTSFLDSCGTP